MNANTILAAVTTVKTTMYIDPSSVTIIASSITAAAVAVGASAIIIWRKLKKKTTEVLHIDPNANKEVEEEVEIYTDDNE